MDNLKEAVRLQSRLGLYEELMGNENEPLPLGKLSNFTRRLTVKPVDGGGGGGTQIANLYPRPWATGLDWDLARLAITLSKTAWAIENCIPISLPELME